MGIMTIGTMTWRNKSIRQISIIRRDVLIAILENSKKNRRRKRLDTTCTDNKNYILSYNKSTMQWRGAYSKEQVDEDNKNL
jgi:hypothetical protein